MELKITIFLFFVFVSAVFNTVLIVGMYKAFAGLTAKVTETVADLGKNAETRQWIDSMQYAAEQAAKVTEVTKLKFAEFDPALSRAEDEYRRTLVTIDTKMEEVAEKVTTTAQSVRDIVAKPAFSV